MTTAKEALVRLEAHEKSCDERMGEIRTSVKSLHGRLDGAIRDRNRQFLAIAAGIIVLLLGLAGFLATKVLGLD